MCSLRRMGDSLGRDEARRRKGRQVTRGEVVRTGAPSAMRRPAGRFGPSARTARRSRALHLGQVKGPMRHPAYQVVASVRLKVPWVSHGEQYTIDSVTPPLLLHQWGLTLARRKRQGRTKRIASLKIREKSGEGGTSDFLVRQPWEIRGSAKSVLVFCPFAERGSFCYTLRRREALSLP